MTVPFMGEWMTCVMCNRREGSDPNRNSQWRAVEVEGRRYYACPAEFPPDGGDGGSVEAFKVAYEKVISRAAALHRARRWR